MRISDWSSDVCSSDLFLRGQFGKGGEAGRTCQILFAQFDARESQNIAERRRRIRAEILIAHALYRTIALIEPACIEGRPAQQLLDTLVSLTPAASAERSETRRLGKEGISKDRQ